LVLLGHEPMIYHTQGEHSNYYIDYVILKGLSCDCMVVGFTWLGHEPMIYHTQGEHFNNYIDYVILKGLSWPWSYGSWIYNYLCNRCLSPLMLWVRLPLRARSTLCDKVCQCLAAGHWTSPGPPVSSTKKTHHHDITEILLKVALNTIKPHQTNLW
jgi:hypothetical protein